MLEKRLTDDYFQVTDKPFESHDTTRSKYVYPYLESFIKTLLRFSETGFTLEGVNLTPKLLSIFADNRHVRSLYLGFADANLSEKYQSLKNHQSTHDWTSEYTDAELKGLVRRKIIKSSRMRRECRKYGIEPTPSA